MVRNAARISGKPRKALACWAVLAGGGGPKLTPNSGGLAAMERPIYPDGDAFRLCRSAERQSRRRKRIEAPRARFWGCWLAGAWGGPRRTMPVRDEGKSRHRESRASGKGIPLAVARRSIAIVNGHGSELWLRDCMGPDGCGQQASREDEKRSEDWVKQAFHRVTPGLLNGSLRCRRQPARTQRGSRPFGCSVAEEWIGYLQRPRECFPRMYRFAPAYRGWRRVR